LAILVVRYSAALDLSFINLQLAGSYTARALAGLLARIGIPRKISRKSLKQLYKKYFNQELKKPEVAEELMNEYSCKLKHLGPLDV
jgi:Uncharacterized alpha/beta hydrolase domain (DUF2235)